MAATQKDPLAIAVDAFIANTTGKLEVDGMKRAHLARKVESAGGPSKKTIYNVLSRAYPPNIETLGSFARALRAPLWVLLIPGLHEHKELLTSEAMARIERLIEAYLEADPEQRAGIETVAAAAVITRRAKSR